MQTRSSSSKTAGNIAPVHSMWCIELILLTLYRLYCIFLSSTMTITTSKKTFFHKNMSFSLGLQTIGAYSIWAYNAFSIGAIFHGAVNYAFSIGLCLNIEHS